MISLESFNFNDYSTFSTQLVDLLQRIDKVEPFTAVPAELVGSIKLFGSDVIAPLINVLSEREYFGRTHLAWIPQSIRQLDIQSKLIVFETAKNGSPKLQACSAWMLGFFRDTSQTEPLIEIFKGTDSCNVRTKIVWALSQIWYLLPTVDLTFTDLIMDTLKTGCADLRPQSARLLGNMKAKESISFLLESLKNEDSALRLESLLALTKLLNRTEGIDLLLSFLQSKDKQIRVFALSYLINLVRNGKNSVEKNLCQIGVSNGINILSDALNYEDRETRFTAAISLSRIATPEAINLLVSALFDEYHEVRRSAVETLFILGDLNCLDALRKVAEFDTSTNIRKRALEAIEKIERDV